MVPKEFFKPYFAKSPTSIAQESTLSFLLPVEKDSSVFLKGLFSNQGAYEATCQQGGLVTGAPSRAR